MKRLFLLILFIYSFQLVAQEERKPISGVINSVASPVQNVHIINLSTNKGIVSNRLGMFKISVRVNDTLLFSNIQYENKMILINKNHIENNYLEVDFILDINELDEIIIKNPNHMAQALGLPNAEKKPLSQTERKVNYYNKGGTITKLYGLISGDQKKRKKIQRLEEADKIFTANQKEILKIRSHFKDIFFMETLDIQKEEINNFITSCMPKGIILLFEQERHLEIVDIFLDRIKKEK